MTTALELKASYEVNTLRIATGPCHRRLVDAFNEYHEALDLQDEETMSRLGLEVPVLLDEFDRTESDKSDNPPWLRCKMRGGWHVARGEFEKALVWEVQGFRHAESEPGGPEAARRMSVSASNIADELTRLGRADEALEWGRLSIELWPSNAINHLVMAMALYRAGLRDQAEHIIEELRRLADFGNENDVLAKCIAYDRELHEMDDLPAVQQLLREMEAAGIM